MNITNSVELKVNVINQLKLLRQSTFKDKLSFLDEDIQNAQRAKAKSVHVTTDYSNKVVIIENDGRILTNPQALFSIAESEWDEKVKNSENPFGMGFFSNITVSNLIEVYSGNKHIVFDVEKMINTNNTEIEVNICEEEYQGFKLVLNNFDFESISRWNVQERVEILGKYIHELDIYYNGELQDKKDLTEGDDSPFQLKIDEDGLKGWISLCTNYWMGDNLNIFYKGRLIKPLENMYYLKGDLHISDKTLNLTSPDRKDIIKDDKLSKFREVVYQYAKQLATDSLLEGTDKELEEVINAVSFYADKTKVKNLIRFMTFKSQEAKDIDYLKGIAMVRRKSKEVKNFNDYHLYLEEEKSKQSESHFNEVEIRSEVKSKPPKARGIVKHSGYSSYEEGYIERPEIKENEVEEKLGEVVIKSDQPTFWMGFNEVEEYEQRLNIAKHYNLRIIVARNKVEEEILKNMKDSDNVLHLSELDEKVEVAATISNTELSIYEKRALMLLEMISRIFEYDYNVFVIGDLMVMKNVTIESINVTNQIIEEDVVAIKDYDAKKVYIDRNIIEKNKLKDNLDTNIDLSDYRFILSNIPYISKELSLLTTKSESEITNTILKVLGNAS